MKLAVSFSLVGTYSMVADASSVLSMSVRIDAAPGNLSEILQRDIPIVGLVRAEGLASGTKLEGKISIRPEERTTRYQFRFATDTGRTLRFFGAQDFLLVDAWGSLFRVEGTAYDATDVEVLRASLKFSPRRELRRVVRSLSLRS